MGKEKKIVFHAGIDWDKQIDVRSINIDHTGTIEVSWQEGTRVEVYRMGMEEAQRIGFINLEALRLIVRTAQNKHT